MEHYLSSPYKPHLIKIRYWDNFFEDFFEEYKLCMAISNDHCHEKCKDQIKKYIKAEYIILETW